MVFIAAPIAEDVHPPITPIHFRSLALGLGLLAKINRNQKSLKTKGQK